MTTGHRHRRSQRRGGTSLPAALAALAVSVSFTAALADLARTEVILARYRRAATAALAAADGCLARLLAAVAPGWDFDTMLAGPDGATGTADDGTLLAPAGCSAGARRPPGAATPARLLVTVDAGAAGGRRRLEAIVGRARAPGLPALLWLGTPPASGTIGGTLDLDGADAADSTAPALAALVAPADPVSLDAWLAGEAPHVATHGAAPPLTAASAPLGALLGRLLAAGAGDVSGLPPAGTLPGGLARVASDLVVDAPLSGAGLLFVEGTLDIRSALDFTGLVVAAGGLRISAGGSLAVGGALWVSGTGGPALLVDGSLRLRQSRAAMDDVDQLLPLPRRAVLLGVKDLS